MCDQVVESCDCVDEETECSDACVPAGGRGGGEECIQQVLSVAITFCSLICTSVGI